MSDQGYRTVPHTADLRIEAWAGSRADCIAAALRGLVSSFADVGSAAPVRLVELRVPAESPADALAAAGDEIIYLLDTEAEIPVSVQVREPPPGTTHLIVTLELASARGAEFTAAIPKAISLHGLACEPDSAGRWSAAMTVDV
jgi:SHS2 domain-containing protein